MQYSVAAVVRTQWLQPLGRCAKPRGRGGEMDVGPSGVVDENAIAFQRRDTCQSASNSHSVANLPSKAGEAIVVASQTDEECAAHCRGQPTGRCPAPEKFGARHNPQACVEEDSVPG